MKNDICVWEFKMGFLARSPILTIKIIPKTANQRRTVDAGFHSNFTQLYGVNWNAIRFIFPLTEHIRNSDEKLTIQTSLHTNVGSSVIKKG